MKWAVEALRNTLQILIFLAWGLLGMWLCLLIRPALSGATLQVTEVTGVTNWWITVTFLLIVFALIASRTNYGLTMGSLSRLSQSDRDTRRDRLALRWGLTAAFASAIPGLVLGVLALVVSLPHYQESLGAGSYRLASQELEKDIRERSRAAYILVVDASASYMSSTVTNGFVNLSRLQLFLEDLLLYERGYLQSHFVSDTDLLQLVLFSGTQQGPKPLSVGALKNELDNAIKKEIEKVRREVLTSQLQKRLITSSTDIVRAIEMAVAEANKGDYLRSDHVTIVIASDFFHDVSTTGEAEARRRLGAVMRDLGERNRIHLLGLIGSKLTREKGRDELDVVAELERFRANGAWRALDLESYEAADGASRKAAVVLGILPLAQQKHAIKVHCGVNSKVSVEKTVVELPSRLEYAHTVVAAGAILSSSSAPDHPRLSLLLSPDDSSMIAASKLVDNCWIATGEEGQKKTISISAGGALQSGSSPPSLVLIASPGAGVIHRLEVTTVPVHVPEVARTLKAVVTFFGAFVALMSLIGVVTVPWVSLVWRTLWKYVSILGTRLKRQRRASRGSRQAVTEKS